MLLRNVTFLIENKGKLFILYMSLTIGKTARELKQILQFFFIMSAII